MGRTSHRARAHESCLNPLKKPLIHFCGAHDGSLPEEGKCPVCHHIARLNAIVEDALTILGGPDWPHGRDLLAACRAAVKAFQGAEQALAALDGKGEK